MPNLRRLFNQSGAFQTKRHRAVEPRLEGLEERLLLYSTLGGQWTYASRITYSFMPDGTSVGGMPSALFQTLNRIAPTATWEQQIEQAATLWESVTNVNLALVPDGGQPVGGAGNQQDDPRFGDIRIGAVPLPSGILAETFDPPPVNGGTDAGDVLLNSNVNWQINSNYDLMTVVAHEFGHALGLGESTVSNAVMYGTYKGIRQALSSDDIAGIQSLYGTRQFDVYNSGIIHDNSPFTATNLNSKIGSNAQIAIPGLDITTPGDSEWFYVNVPYTTTGTMTVTVQSSNLSSLSPSLAVYNSSLSLVGQVSAPNSMGATISITDCGVAPGQGFYIKVLAATGYGGIGGYGLLANFGSQTQSPIQPPNTVVAAAPDQGGGTSFDNAPSGNGQNGQGGGFFGGLNPWQSAWTSVGNLSDWTSGLNVNSAWWQFTASAQTIQSGSTTASAPVQIGPGYIGMVTQNTSQFVGLVIVSSPAAQATPAPIAAGPALSVLQALDNVLAQWNWNF